MATNKTTKTENSVPDFINTVEDSIKRSDSFKLLEIFHTATGFEPKMWGPSIIGFGSYHYKYKSGHEGDAPLTGFSPRKDNFALYLSLFEGREALLEKLGKHKTAKACIYIKKVDDIDIYVLKEIILASVKNIKTLYP